MVKHQYGSLLLSWRIEGNQYSYAIRSTFLPLVNSSYFLSDHRNYVVQHDKSCNAFCFSTCHNDYSNSDCWGTKTFAWWLLLWGWTIVKI